MDLSAFPSAARVASAPTENRLHPSIIDRGYLCLAPLAEILADAIRSRLAGKELRVLDLGCGEKPYAPLLAGQTRLYIGLDLPGPRMADVHAGVDLLPFRSSSFDLVLCTQVLEHVPNPQGTVDEARRGLADGGLLLLSTHGVWIKHADRDYWRWTDAGLMSILRNFRDVQVRECGGQYSALFQIVNLYADPLPLGRRAIYFLNNLMGLALDKIHPAHGLVTNYVVIATK